MITNETFVSFLNCHSKTFLQATRCSGERSDIERIQLDLERLYLRQALAGFLGLYDECDIVRDPTSLEAAVRGRPRFIVNVTARAEDICSQLHLAERIEGMDGR